MRTITRTSILKRFTGSTALFLGMTQWLSAQEEAVPTINGGDTAFLLVASALVLFMTPGLAFFYGGLVRRKNMLSVLMQCFVIIGLISLQWLMIGYSFSFASQPLLGGFVGDLQFLGLKGVGAEPFGTIPHSLFMIFQGMFAVITPALITGAFAERTRFSAMCLFMVLWATFVYNPVCHWVWGGGCLMKMGALDFAGGTVVHINAGMAALAFVLFIGKRKGFPEKMSPPHNLPFAVLGAGILWFGWFGFNAGSRLAADGVAANAFVVTHMAACAALVTWAILDWVINGKPTVLGVITGAVAGLVAITPASGYVNPTGAVIIGCGVSIVCYFFVAYAKPAFGYDDSLDVFGVHGIGGMWGAIATGFLADPAINTAAGSVAQTIIQVKSVAVTAVYSFVVTGVLLFIVNAIIPVRIAEREEVIGLDLSEHKESAYTVLD